MIPLANFSGRTADNVPLTGYLRRADVPLFMTECRRFHWRRVAVGEGNHILAAYNGGEIYLHPQLRGDQ